MMERPLRALRDDDAVEADLASTRIFEDFFESEHARLFGALCLVTSDRHEAEEIMQEAFLRLWERWDRVSGIEDPSGYLFRTAMNVFRNRYRRAALALRRTVSPGLTEDVLGAVEDRDQVVRALKSLSPPQRAAIVLTSYVGMTSEEAGRLLRMKPATVRTLASRARTAIREKAVISDDG
jgi:RNA polymerase sigma-70 factor (ECF subfamily)